MLNNIPFAESLALSPFGSNNNPKRWQLSYVKAVGTSTYSRFNYRCLHCLPVETKTTDTSASCECAESVSSSDIWQVSGDPLDGGRSQQHRQMSETHRRPRAVPHISDPPGIKGEVSGKF